MNEMRIGLALLVACASGCAGTEPPPAQGSAAPAAVAERVIVGTATYRERIALPSGAEFEAVLEDVSLADAPATEIGRTTSPKTPMPPIHFEIPYDAAKIDSTRRYAVRAAIRVDGTLWFASDTAHPVLTHGAGDRVDILLKRTAEPPAADEQLLNTYWKIISLAGEPVTVAEGRREPHLILRSADGRDSWSATAGCNQMSGALTVASDRIGFAQGVATLMGCPPPLDAMEEKLTRALAASTQWRIEGKRLELRDDAGTQTFLCEAVHMK
jgi:putative lipoprotein